MIRDFLIRFKTNTTAMAGLIIILLLFLAAVLAPLIAPADPYQTNLSARLAPPSQAYLLGTDELGRDVFSRMLWGARVSISVGLIAVSISIIIGTLLGIISGYFGGWTDKLLMRFVDVMLCFPTFFLILIVLAFLEPSIVNVMIVIGLTSWPSLTRLVRAEVLSIKERDYIAAAKLLGLGKTRILFMHILPNTLSPILVSATLGVGAAILTESGLSFLGLGVQPPASSWGQMLTAGKDYIYFAWWLSLFPGLAILAAVLSFNLLGEGLKAVLSARSYTSK